MFVIIPTLKFSIPISFSSEGQISMSDSVEERNVRRLSIAV